MDFLIQFLDKQIQITFQPLLIRLKIRLFGWRRLAMPVESKEWWADVSTSLCQWCFLVLSQALGQKFKATL